MVVLSNNDGCVTARSNKAKALGIKTGAPYHEMKTLFTNNGVKAFSSNYTQYGDMSSRMMEILSQFSPDLEVYTIDECFLGMSGFRVYRSFELPVATSDTRQLDEPVQFLFKKAFRNGVRYHKCGILLQELCPADFVQQDLFNAVDTQSSKKYMSTIDLLNKRFGRNTMHFASTGFTKQWITQANHRSPSYTTKWKDLLTVQT